MRLLLGAAEAGFFPGVILYLTYWFPAEYRARIIGMFTVAIPVSSFLGSPISAALLGTEGWLGLHGWQWMFILEAVPAVLLGIVCLAVLNDGPADARWLTPEQRGWLVGRLREERVRLRPVGQLTLWQVLCNKHVLDPRRRSRRQHRDEQRTSSSGSRRSSRRTVSPTCRPGC